MESFRVYRGPVLTPSAFAKGFTLVEMLVVFAIITIIAGVIITSQSNFNKTVILSNTAFDVALTLRSTQAYGLSNRAKAGLVDVGYGVHFESSTPGSFKLFADSGPAPSRNAGCHQTNDPSKPDAKPGNCAYLAAEDEEVSTYALGNGVVVSDFCLRSSTGVRQWSCASRSGGGLGNRISTLDIVFSRPNAEPFVSADGTWLPKQSKTACLILSREGATRYVYISPSGGIAVQTSRGACPI